MLYYSGNNRQHVLILTVLTVPYYLLSLCLLLRLLCIHDVNKFWLQGCTSNQKPVDIRLRGYTDTSQSSEDCEG